MIIHDQVESQNTCDVIVPFIVWNNLLLYSCTLPILTSCLHFCLNVDRVILCSSPPCLTVGFENDMVTLVLSVGRCHSLRQLALGKNFAMKSRSGEHNTKPCFTHSIVHDPFTLPPCLLLTSGHYMDIYA